jgi:hypothetical protein
MEEGGIQHARKGETKMCGQNSTTATNQSTSQLRGKGGRLAS